MHTYNGLKLQYVTTILEKNVRNKVCSIQSVDLHYRDSHHHCNGRTADRAVTGQLADCQLADWTTHILDKSWTGQLEDVTGSSTCCYQVAKKRKLTTQSRRWHPRVVQSVTCPVRELTSPRDVQSASHSAASWQSTSWHIHELSSNHQHPSCLHSFNRSVHVCTAVA